MQVPGIAQQQGTANGEKKSNIVITLEHWKNVKPMVGIYTQ